MTYENTTESLLNEVIFLIQTTEKKLNTYQLEQDNYKLEQDRKISEIYSILNLLEKKIEFYGHKKRPFFNRLFN